MRISDWSSDVCSSDLVGEGNYNRNDSLEGVPSELIGGIEVFKSPNASLLEGGLGGIVNLKTRNPLDLQDGLTAAGNFKMSKGSEIGGWEPAGAAVLGYNFNDRLGLIESSRYEQTNNKIGRASCRERVCQYVKIAVVAI